MPQDASGRPGFGLLLRSQGRREPSFGGAPRRGVAPEKFAVFPTQLDYDFATFQRWIDEWVGEMRMDFRPLIELPAGRRLIANFAYCDRLAAHHLHSMAVELGLDHHPEQIRNIEALLENDDDFLIPFDRRMSEDFLALDLVTFDPRS